jgi:2,3-bisphosphoglycerate-independent phosphoglycerate mutase
MAEMPIAPVVLVILDGWGYRKETEGNAISAAKTPCMDSLWDAYPRTLINTSGRAVGLPQGQMGNSEVGHLNLGAGRIVPQELVRISDAVDDDILKDNSALIKVCKDVRDRQGKLHLVGLCSHGGVHSHTDHLIGLLKIAKYYQVEDVCIHAITDGRDTNPREGIKALAEIEKACHDLGIGRIVTVSGRFFAMDRDNRWDRVEKTYQVMTQSSPIAPQTVQELMTTTYGEGITDEFINPTRIAPGEVSQGDGVVFFNFRPDRARQLTSAFVSEQFTGFTREKIEPLTFVTFTQYDPTLPVLVAFAPQKLENILGEVIANQGLRQFRTAETEKYAHVTYFFNGGGEQPFPGEDRELVSSPMVRTYDLAPAMSAKAVTETAIAAIKKGIYSLIVVNYANPDMVGHTGKMEPTKLAIESVDRCLGELLGAIIKMGGTTLITADHGNAEYMWDENHQPWTAHTTNQVPFILVDGEKRRIPGYGTNVQLRNEGKLADIAPTILQILDIPQPKEMTGISMILPLDHDLTPLPTPVQIGVS